MIISDVDLEIEAGSQLSEDFLSLGDITTRTALYFGVKNSKADTDANALILIEETAGLLYIAGAAASVALNGTITVTSAVRGDIRVTLSDTETVKLVETSGKSYYQIKWLDATSEAHNLEAGRALILTSPVREV